MTAPEKRFHSLVVDTGPLIKNTISISTILQSAEHIYSTPAILSEIKDAATRSRVETTLLPFLNVRSPAPASYDAVAQFSKKTGDFPVLSRQDLGILALAYEIDQERQKIAAKQEADKKGEVKAGGHAEDAPIERPDAETQPAATPPAPVEETTLQTEEKSADSLSNAPQEITSENHLAEGIAVNDSPASGPSLAQNEDGGVSISAETIQESNGDVPGLTDTYAVQPTAVPEQAHSQSETSADVPSTEDTLPSNSVSLEAGLSNLAVSPQSESDPDDDGEGEWITPSNLKKHQNKDTGVSVSEAEPAQISVATMTTDYAMQNVLLQMKLALISPSMQRIRNLRTYILRCHACFLTTKQMDKQFCPRCGQPTLTRVSCSTNAKGEFRIHLAKNYQWNNRGNKYSVPKPVNGTPNGKNIKGGGKGGWGNELILAEDQIEYVRHQDQQKRSKARDLMDEDYLPNILTGDRGRAGGRAKVGAGRNVNSKKRF